MKKIIVHKSVAPIYIAAAVWALYALLFPLYSVGHFVIAGVAALAAFLIGKSVCKDVQEEIEVEPEPERTGNAALDQMLEDGRKAIAEMKRLDDAIEDEAISADIVRLEEVSGRIFEFVKENPGKLSNIRKFMNYYLPTTLKLLNAYDRANSLGVEGSNVNATKQGVEEVMKQIVTAFERQLDALFDASAMDISTDITVLENMMAREGLADDIVHRTVQEEKTDDEPSDGGIQLEL